MSRHADPARIAAARRAAVVARLIGAGELPHRAAAWVARWEATMTGPPGRVDWEAFDVWLALERTGGDGDRRRGGPDQPGRQEV